MQRVMTAPVWLFRVGAGTQQQASLLLLLLLLLLLGLVPHPSLGTEVAPDGIPWDYGIRNANLGVGEVCYIGSADCVDASGDGAVYDCQLTIDGKTYVTDNACAASADGITCLTGVALSGNYSQFSAGTPANAHATAASATVNAGPFDADTAVYAFRCACTQVRGPEKTSLSLC